MTADNKIVHHNSHGFVYAKIATKMLALRLQLKLSSSS